MTILALCRRRCAARCRRTILGMAAMFLCSVILCLIASVHYPNKPNLEFTAVQLIDTVSKWLPNGTSSVFSLPLMTTPSQSRGKMTSTIVAAARLGNVMFVHASLLGLAHRHHFTPVLTLNANNIELHNYFELKTSTRDPFSANEQWNMVEEKKACAYDNDIDATIQRLIGLPPLNKSASIVKNMSMNWTDKLNVSAADPPAINIQLQGYRQSWRYFNEIQDDIRREFTFNQPLRTAAQRFLSDVRKNIADYFPDFRKLNNAYNSAGYSDLAKVQSAEETVQSAFRGNFRSARSAETDLKVLDAQSSGNNLLQTLNESSSEVDKMTAVTRPVTPLTPPLEVVEKVTIPVLDDVLMIGVQVRRGDMMNAHQQEQGYTTATVEYIVKAMKFMEQKFAGHRLVYIVASEDKNWCKQAMLNQTKFPVLFSNQGSFPSNLPGAALDLAIMAACDHVITTVGTYSWWAGYLAGGTTVYYKNFPRPGSSIGNVFRAEDYYLPDWVGLE